MNAKNLIKPPIKMSATMAMNAKIGRLRAEGHQVLHLGFGEARFPVHPKILAAFREHATARSYLPVAGLPELRARIADYYRRKFQIQAEAGQVMIGSGSKSLLFAAMQALEGDVLLPAPTWVSYDVQAYLTGKKVSWIPTHLEDNHCLTPEGLKAGLKAARDAGQTPTILVLNSPGNPTGVIYPAPLLTELAEVARTEGMVVISDEIYGLTSYGDIPFTSMALYYPEGTIVTGGLSKHLSLGGWRFGVAVLPPGDFGAELYRYMAAVASNVWTTVTAPVQYAALIAYGADPEIDAYVETCTTIHGYVTGYLYQLFHSLNVPSPTPSGGFYVYPSLAPWREALARKHNVHTSLDLANFLLDEEHMATLPGSDFGADPGDLTLRVATSYLYALTDEAGEAILATYQKNLPPEQFLREACPYVIEAGERFRALVESLG
jgi:aspartate/methionine/tyrosine aminotransferase